MLSLNFETVLTKRKWNFLLSLTEIFEYLTLNILVTEPPLGTLSQCKVYLKLIFSYLFL